MSKGNIFWGFLLVIAGALLMAGNFGLITFEIRLLWPLLVIALGVYILMSRSWEPSGTAEEQSVTVQLEGATEANVRLEYGAGTVRIGGTASADQLLSGTFSAMKLSTKRNGSKLTARLSTDTEQAFAGFLPWNWHHTRREWNFALNPNIPTALKIECGAADTRMDLSVYKITKLDLDTGASSTNLTLPAAAGHTQAKIAGGAASFEVRIPEGVAARIHVESGLGSISVDQTRFPRDGKYYESPNFDQAVNKVDLKLEVGVSSVVIK